jgi:hypothetical protein
MQKYAFGSDLLMDMEVKKTLCEEFPNRTKWFSNAEILKQATSVNGEIMALIRTTKSISWENWCY